MTRTLLLLLGLLAGAAVQAQRLDSASLAVLQQQQDSLQYLAYNILNGRTEDARRQSSDRFIPKLVQALKTKYSFDFPFDSIRSVSIQYPEDSTFRIFSWGLEMDNGFYHHYGAIQMNTKNGELKLFPLFDNSDYGNADTVAGNKAWYGCLYYKILQRHYFNREYYTLFGYDANNLRSTKKLLDMLTFKDGQPVFGGPYFSFAEDTVPKPVRNRFIVEYKKEATISLSYNPEMDMIVYDHLISATNEPGKPYTYVPDLDYEGFKWKAGKWVHIEKVFHDALERGKFPVQHPLDQRKKDLMHPQTAEEMEAEKAGRKRKNR
ncbi:hypothetical protein [Chitinophaga japonensis]|uniref:Uncharacterized protein n=1 Tax=Chitinophaga japonensis TaxID=104662 RepID=A0A562T6Q9_CHIJA|nr:hypothetical protein [Chitinophaga japonensis]TWI89227.1 hypothetical protein LX66_3321 [Chitinophaga japonensis]